MVGIEKTTMQAFVGDVKIGEDVYRFVGVALVDTVVD